MCKLEFYRNVSGERQLRDIGSKSGQKSGQSISLDLPATATKSGQRDRGRKTANQLLFFVSFTKILFCFHPQGFFEALLNAQLFLYFDLAQFFLCFLAWVGNTASRSMQKHAATKPSSFSPIPRIFKNKAIFFTADASLLILTHSPQSPDFENISKFYCRDATKLGPRCF